MYARVYVFWLFGILTSGRLLGDFCLPIKSAYQALGSFGFLIYGSPSIFFIISLCYLFCYYLA